MRQVKFQVEVKVMAKKKSKKKAAAAATHKPFSSKIQRTPGWPTLKPKDKKIARQYAHALHGLILKRQRVTSDVRKKEIVIEQKVLFDALKSLGTSYMLEMGLVK